MPTSLDDLRRLPSAQRRALRRLLVSSVAAWPDTNAPALTTALTEGAPLEHVPAAADIHRVAPLVDRAVGDVRALPPKVRRELADSTRQVAARHLRSIRALRQIGAALDDAGVPWVVMKGPVLSAQVYGDAGARDYRDIDLLVARQRFPDAVAALERAGFAHRIRNWPLASWYVAGQIQMTREDIEIDLHWHLLYAHYDRRGYDLDVESMIERRRDVPVGGQDAPTLDPVDTLIAAGFHATTAGGHRLLWLKDIALAYEVLRPDPDELVTRCRDYGCSESVGLALLRAATVLDAETEAMARTLLGPGLRWIDGVAQRIQPVVQFDDRDTLPRFVARSARSTPGATITDAARRTGRAARRRVGIDVGDETNDPVERARFLEIVAGGSDPM